MTWNVHLWCNQCGEGGTMIGSVDDVQTRHPAKPGEPSPHTVVEIMREHEVEKHGGKS